MKASRSLLGFILGGLAMAGACGGDAPVVSLNVTSPDSVMPQIGDEVGIVVWAIRDDGSSTDVTAQAACSLSGANPPGRLEGPRFFAEQSGTTDVTCTYDDLSGTLAISVAGFVSTPIAAIQRGDYLEETSVEVSAVVYAIDPDGDWTNFFAQDAGGGAHSGIYVRDVRELAADEVGVSPVAVGDVVTIRGTYVERSGKSVINYDEVEVTGTGEPTVDVLEVADVDPAIWDGCLIGVRDVVVTNEQVDDYTWAVGPADAPESATLLVETLLHDAARSNGLGFSAIDGPLYLWQDEGATEVAYAIMPRSSADLATVAVDTTIADLRAGSAAPGSTVTLADVVVTAIDPYQDDLVDLYVQDAGGGAALFLRDVRDVGSAVAEGDLVTVTGTLEMRGGRLVISFDALSKTGAAAPTVTDIDIATVDLRAHESALVRIGAVRVTNDELDAYTWEATDDRDGGTATMAIETVLYENFPAVGTTYSSVTGVVYCDDTLCALAPRGAADLAE